MLAGMLALPAARHALEGTMTAQMLIQMPLLVLSGWLICRGLPSGATERLASWNAGGIPGLILVSMTSLVWMLPRMLDASVLDTRFAFAKYTSIPFLIGLPLALSWPRAGFVVKGVFLLELVATAFRLGWLYLVSPVRLCTTYLLDDQQRLGRYLLVAGVVMSVVLGWKLIFGRIRV